MSPNFTVCLCKTKRVLRFLHLAYPMHQIRKSLFFWLAFSSCTVFAQYTGVINSNKPGFSESPYSVGTGVYQFESSFFFRKIRIDPVFSRPQSSGLDLLFRTSFFKEKLELNVNLSYQRDQIAFKNIFTSSYFTSGLGKFTIAGKYLLYEQEYIDKSKEIRSWKERHRFDWTRLIPSVAIYVGINTDFVNEIHKENGMSPKFGVLLQNDFSSKFNVVTNIFYDKIGTDIPETSYIITGTYSLNDRWSTFIENQTIFTKLRVSSNIGSGLAFLYNKNIQINSSLRFVKEGETPGFYTTFGVSYRLDNHVDEVIETDEFGNPIEEIIKASEKKGFFNRLFSKITGVFKKKNKKKAAKNIELKTKTIESIRKNTNKDEVTLNNDTIKKVSKPIRTRPKRVRVKPTKKDTKKIEKKKNKKQKKEEREKKKEEARKEKERKKKKKADDKKKNENN